VKVIRHQTIAQKIRVRAYILPHFPQEKQVVFGAKENLLPVIALIVNVEYCIFFEAHDGLGLM